MLSFRHTKQASKKVDLNIIVYILNYVIYQFFYEESNMQNIPLLEQVFNKGKDETISGLPYSTLLPQSTLVHCIEVININPYWLQLHLLETVSFTDSLF